MWLKQEKSQEVEGFVVRHGTAVVATLPLEDSTIVVRGDVGPVTVQVEHGFARVTKSTCPHKICNHSAAIQTSGSIVCVPNRIVVEPRAKTSDVDAYVR